jgi:hypothetical protein
MWYEHPDLSATGEAMRELCFHNLVNGHASDLYIRSKKEDALARMSESDQKIWKTHFDEIIDTIFDTIDADVDVLGEAHQVIGAQLSDLLGVMPWILKQEVRDCILVGGLRHIEHLTKWLPQHGYTTMLTREGKNETNCIQSEMPPNPSLRHKPELTPQTRAYTRA